MSEGSAIGGLGVAADVLVACHSGVDDRLGAFRTTTTAAATTTSSVARSGVRPSVVAVKG
jgi:hypothetical protein